MPAFTRPDPFHPEPPPTPPPGNLDGADHAIIIGAFVTFVAVGLTAAFGLMLGASVGYGWPILGALLLYSASVLLGKGRP